MLTVGLQPHPKKMNKERTIDVTAILLLVLTTPPSHQLKVKVAEARPKSDL